MKKCLVIITCLLCLLLTAGTEPALYSPKVLMYHLVLEEPFSDYTSLFVRPFELEQQVELLQSWGYSFLFAEEYRKTARPSVVLTFDDGYVDNYTEMYPILKKHNVKATVFLIADFIDRPGYLSREQIREMSDSGLVSFQSHTKTHKDLTTLSNADLRTEFRYSKYAIEQVTGKPVRAISYPQGQYTDKMTAVVREYFDRGYGTKPRPIPKGQGMYSIFRTSVVRDYTIDQFAKLISY